MDSDEFRVEVIARDRKVSQQFLADIRRLADEHSIYKGNVVQMKEVPKRYDHVLEVHIHKVPAIGRSDLVLPEPVMKEIEHHTSVFSSHQQALASRGRHLKRGILLYGPPGTGKSMTVMYLIGQMPDRTCILLNGRSGFMQLENACEMARTLAPSTIVIDDVDLVAQNRARRQDNTVLFELLNQMDGIADDADVLFVLTTNRPEELEPALAERPGRIDHAILIPLPDRECRLRLFELYSKGLPLAVKDLQKYIDRTEDVSAAFIRELFRTAAVFALEEGAETRVQDRHLDLALGRLLEGSKLTAKFLGNRTESAS